MLKTPKRQSKDCRFGVLSVATKFVSSFLVQAFNQLKALISTLLCRKAILVITLLLVPGSVLLTAFNHPVQVHAAPSTYLNFQARLLNSSGGLVPDGTYNIEFKLYKSLAAGSSTQGVCVGGVTDDCEWLETRTGGNTITVTNGYMSVNLGSVTAFSTTIDWSSQQFLVMRIGGTGAPSWDTEMTPRISLTAVPLAYVANNVNSGNTSVASTNSAAAAVQSGNATGTTSNSGALTVQSGTATGTSGNLTVSTGNTGTGTSGNISLDVGTATTKGTISIGTTVSNSISIGNSTAATALTLLGGSTGGVNINNSGTGITAIGNGSAGAITIQSGSNITIGTIDATGTLLVLDTKNTAGDPTGVTGGMYYNSNAAKFRCYENGAWKDCDTTGAGSGVTTVGTIGTPTANGATITGSTLNLAVADSGNPGLLSTVAQSIAGTKSFTGAITVGTTTDLTGKVTVGGTVISGGTKPLLTVTNFNLVLPTISATTQAIFASANSGVDSANVSILAGSLGTATLSFGDTSTERKGYVQYDNNANNLLLDTTGTLSLGITNSTGTSLGKAGTTLTVNPTAWTAIPTISGLITATSGLTSNGTLTVGAGQNLALSSGSGTFAQTFTTAAAASAHSIAVTNTNSGAGITVQGVDLTPTNATATSGGTNLVNVLNFNAATALLASDNTNGINFASATGYTNFIKTPTAILSSAGTLTGLTGLTIASGGITVTTGGLTVSGNSTIAGTLTSLTGLTSSGTINFSGLATSQAVFTDGSKNLVSTGTSAALSAALTDETGTGVAVFGTSPTFTTSIIGAAGSFDLLNTAVTSINFGGAATGTVNIGNTSGAINLNGNTTIAAGKNVTYGATGNFNQAASSGTFASGTGAVSLNGNATVAGGKSLTVTTGSTFTNASSTLFTSIPVSMGAGGNIPSGGSGTTGASTTVDVATTFDVTATVASLTLTLPNPTIATSGRVVYVNNVGGTNSFTLYGVTLAIGNSNSYMWNGTGWTSMQGAGVGGSGVNTIGAFSNVTSYANGATITGGNTLTLGAADATNPGLLTASAQTIGGNKTLTGTLLQKSDSSTAFVLQDSTGTYNNLTFDSSTNHLRVYSGGGTRTAYIEMYYDDATSTGIIASSSGAIQVGSGSSGDINLLLISATTKLNASKTYTAAAPYSNNDFNFTRTITGGTNAVTGNVFSLQDQSTFTGGGSISSNVLYINQNNTSATGNLIVAKTGGATDQFRVSTAGDVYANGSLTGNLGATITGAVINLNASSNFATNINTGTSTGAVSIGNNTGNPAINIDSGTSAINIGTGNQARTLNVGTGGAIQGVTIGSTFSTSALTLRAGTGNLNLNTNSASASIIAKSSTNSTSAFQIQNAGGSNVFNADTTGANANNLITTLTASGSPSFEGNVFTGWTGAGGCTLSAVTSGTTIPFNGNYSGQCSNTATIGAEYKYVTGALTTSTVYTLNFYAKVSATSGNFLSFGHRENSGAEDVAGLSLSTQYVTTSGWTRYSLTFKTGGFLAATDYLYIKQTDATSRSLWIDGVTFQTDANADTNYREGKVEVGGVVDSSLVLQNATNSTTAFQVANASGASIFNVDTTDTNLIGNPGAEVNSVGWSVKGSGTIIRDTSKQKFGSGSFKIVTTAASGDGAQYAGLSLPVGTYSIGVSVLNSGSAFGAAKLEAGITNGGGDNVCTLAPAVSATIPTTTGWTRFTCSVTIATTTGTALYIKQTEAVAHTFWVDGIELSSGSVSSPYGAGSISINGVIKTPLTLQNQSDSTTAFLIQNAAGTGVLAVDTLNKTLKVFGTAGSGYASISYVDGTSTAVFAASSGITQIGSVNGGNINLMLTGVADQLFTTKTLTPAADYSTNDFKFTRNVSAFATAFNLSGNVLTVEDTSSLGSGTSTPNVLYINQSNTSATGNLIMAQTGGVTDVFKVSTAGTVTVKSGGTYTGAGAVTLSSAATTALTLTGTSGGTSIGDSAVTQTINIGGVTNSGTDTINIATDGTASDTISIGNTGTTTALTLQSGSGNITLNTTTGNKVVIGSVTTDTNQTLLQLDSFSTFADTATCTTSTNQGSMYYNTNSNSMRGCINGAWEDLVSTAGLGLQLFGIVTDSGANPGDLAAVTGVQNGPCKVSVGATTSTISWTACTAYSGGRKTLVTAGTAATSAGSSATIIFQHLCLTAAGNQPALSAIGLEAANLSTVSMPSVTSPILCLADIKTTNGSAVITTVYDTRTYTTTAKETVTIGTTNPTVGMLVQSIATKGTVIPMATAGGSNIAGVVVATTGSFSTTTINAIIAINGPAAVKAITGTNVVNAYVVGTATAGFANTSATHTATSTSLGFFVLGNARTVWSGATACTINADSCAGSILVSIKLL
jgi:hypothetical protein